MKITQPTLGIDIAKEKFDVALLLPDQQQPLQKEFANNATGHKKLLSFGLVFIGVQILLVIITRTPQALFLKYTSQNCEISGLYLTKSQPPV